MSVSSRLLRLVLVVLLPGVAAAALSVWFLYHQQRVAREQSVAQSAQAIAQLVDREVAASAEILSVLAASPELQRGHLEAFYEHALRTVAGPDSTIILSDLAGNQLLNTRRPLGTVLPRLDQSLLMLRQQAPGTAAIVSDVFIAPLSRQLEFAVQVPVYVQGRLTYFLNRGMDTERLLPLLAAQGFPERWRLAVVDRRGAVVARSKDNDKYAGKIASPALMAKVGRAPSGTNLGTTLDGIPVLAFFHRAPWSQWTLVLSVPVAELESPARDAALLLACLMVLLMAGGVLAARRASYRIAQPIAELAQAAGQLGRGAMPAAPRTGMGEIDAVHESLRQAARQIASNQEELERQVADAVVRTEQAQRALQQAQKLEALGRLTGGVAHDFNNVLQTLTTGLELLRRETDPVRRLDRLAMCDKAIDRAAALVGQLRSFGRVQDAALRTVDVRQVLDAAVPLLRNGAAGLIDLQVDLGAALGSVKVDPVQLDMALLNLVINARDALPNGGSIALSADVQAVAAHRTLAPGRYVRIAVRDTGTGMPREVLERAAEPFFTTKAEHGAGLGLAQVFGFVRQCGGDLEIASTEGQGTTVTLYLPQSGEQADAVPDDPAASTAAPAHPRQTILFVDDDPLIRDTMGALLEHWQYEVIAAADADEALALLEGGLRIDVLMSDIVMPGSMNGVALARQVRARWPQLHVVLATGYANERVELEGVQVLAKPYQSDALLALLERAAA